MFGLMICSLDWLTGLVLRLFGVRGTAAIMGRRRWKSCA